MRVLVVDDDPLVRESCRRILSEEHEVLTSDSAAAALGVIAAGGVHLVLADLMMPARDGFSLIAEVIERWPSLRVLAMTGYSTASIRERCVALGAAGFVPKPFAPDELLTAVRESLAGCARR